MDIQGYVKAGRGVSFSASLLHPLCPVAHNSSHSHTSALGEDEPEESKLSAKSGLGVGGRVLGKGCELALPMMWAILYHCPISQVMIYNNCHMPGICYMLSTLQCSVFTLCNNPFRWVVSFSLTNEETECWVGDLDS